MVRLLGDLSFYWVIPYHVIPCRSLYKTKKTNDASKLHLHIINRDFIMHTTSNVICNVSLNQCVSFVEIRCA
jgi:hypothetical protein